MIPLFGLCFLLSSALAEEPALPAAWRCEDPVWESEPGSTQGIFASALRMDCRYPLGADRSAPAALQAIRSRVLEVVEHRTVHAGPLAAERDGLSGVKYDVSHTVTEDGTPIQFREWVWIAGDSSARLVYATETIDIQASGTAGYLREVRFSADLAGPARDAASELKLTLRNAVRIKRPWYALDLFFSPIATRVCREKFLGLRETVLPLLNPG